MIAWQGPPMPPTRLHALLLAAAAGPLAGCFVDPGNTGTAAFQSTGDAATEASTDAATEPTVTTTSFTPTTTAPTTDPDTDGGVCGDAALDPGEDCDNGAANNGQNGSMCKADCTLNVCGDGYLASVEGCDDGDLEPGDGCGPTCATEGCGDGLVQRGEECDDGNGEPGDDCTNLCKLPICGDGVVQVAHEECDDGNGDDGDGCSAACLLEVCGDGVLQAGEACDDGDLIAGDGCDGACQRDAAFVFATSKLYKGALGGLAGGDQICNDLAAAAGLPGTYAAWLSTSFSGPQQRFKPALLPYVLPDGSPIAASWADLIDGTLLRPIDLHEDGSKSVSAGGCDPLNIAWSNTKSNAVPISETHCNAWTTASAGVSGRAGRLDALDSQWSNDCAVNCANALHLYCFEQGA